MMANQSLLFRRTCVYEHFPWYFQQVGWSPMICSQYRHYHIRHVYIWSDNSLHYNIPILNEFLDLFTYQSWSFRALYTHCSLDSGNQSHWMDWPLLGRHKMNHGKFKVQFKRQINVTKHYFFVLRFTFVLQDTLLPPNNPWNPLISHNQLELKQVTD